MGVTMIQWAAKGACRGSDPDALFVEGAAQNRAKVVCLSCPVRMECLSDALDHRIEFGVWGGMTERERRALLRRRPDVQSWRRLLEAARAEQASVIGLPDGKVPAQAGESYRSAGRDATQRSSTGQRRAQSAVTIS
jgi:WhiB family transcriptional regulator, redox-sensing transcriptional regulator